MKLHHWYPNSAGKPIYSLRRAGQQWHIWFGLHVWILEFACKCRACRLQRRRAWFERWFGVTITDEEMERGARFWGPRGERIVKEAITQQRFRDAMKAEKENKNES